MKKITLLFILILVAIFGIKSFPKHTETKQTNLSVYELPILSTATPIKYVVEYPYVSVSPLSGKYFLIPVYEDFQILSKQRNRLFFAAKRVAEINTWKKELKIERVDDFAQWSEKNKFAFLSGVKKYDSWESLLARYNYLMSQEIQSLDLSSNVTANSQNAEGIKIYVLENRVAIEKAIQESKLDDSSQKYLNTLVSEMFTKFAQNINLNFGILHKEGLTTYSLKNVVNNNDYGDYKLVVSFPALFTNKEINNSLLYIHSESGDRYIHLSGPDSKNIFHSVLISLQQSDEYIGLQMDGFGFTQEGSKLFPNIWLEKTNKFYEQETTPKKFNFPVSILLYILLISIISYFGYKSKKTIGNTIRNVGFIISNYQMPKTIAFVSFSLFLLLIIFDLLVLKVVFDPIWLLIAIFYIGFSKVYGKPYIVGVFLSSIFLAGSLILFILGNELLSNVYEVRALIHKLSSLGFIFLVLSYIQALIYTIFNND